METPISETISVDAEKQATAQRPRDKDAVHLLKTWLQDESGYDEETWPKLKNAIEAHRLSHRRRFHG